MQAGSNTPLAPFSLEENNRLHWLFLRDITELSRQQAKQARVKSQTEALLAEKTRQLAESEKAREKHATEVESLKEKLQNPSDDGRLIGSSAALRSLLKQIREVAADTSPVLICGEPGTGKGRVAQMIRAASSRQDRPCLEIDCRTAKLDEAALFGHAEHPEPGIFELVDSGTLFLDGVETLPLPRQNALLKTLREGEIIPVDSNHAHKVNVRVIATASADLPALVQNGAFRQELYYRLAVNTVAVAPLRQRPEDIADLISFFVRKYRRRYGKQVNYLPQTVIDLLINHPWPGNVAELQELVRRAVLLAGGSAITEQEIIFERQQSPAETPRPEQNSLGNFFNQPLKDVLEDFEKNLVSFIKQ